MSSKKQAQVFHFNLYGKREEKYEFLKQQSIDSIPWTELEVKEPNFFFVKKDFGNDLSYRTFFSLTALFNEHISGVETKRDKLFIEDKSSLLSERIGNLLSHEISDNFKAEFNVIDSSSYKLIDRIKRSKYKNEFIREYNYRPFDKKFIYYDNDLIGRSMISTLRNMLYKDNVAIVSSKQCHGDFTYAFISTIICDGNYLSSAKLLGGGYVFPLYIYPKNIGQQTIGQILERIPNFNTKIIKQIADNLDLLFTNEKEPTLGTFAPIDILDYIYAVLHSPTYREKYKEFLKIDFPRVPYPKDADTFWHLVKLGGELRQIHLLESPVVSKFITKYPVEGNNLVTKPRFEPSQHEYHLSPLHHGTMAPLENGTTHQFTSSPIHQIGRVWINETQYFVGVPQVAWDFYIGGYQPAQKWLKDRKSRVLNFEDILHYQKIIVALAETARIMTEVDKVSIE